MGTYLSKPITEKVSEDGHKEYLGYGSSSMQGWRMNQEDAHNTILDFDEKKGFFAVYDGHGGHEVAAYTAEFFPKFLKNSEKYKNKDYENALKESFLKFDDSLITPDVQEALKEISGTKDDADTDDEQEEVDHLCREANMPLEEVMEKYSKTYTEISSHNAKCKKSFPGASGSGISKVKSDDVIISEASSSGSSSSSSTSIIKEKSSSTTITNESSSTSIKKESSSKQEEESHKLEDSKSSSNGEKVSSSPPKVNGTTIGEEENKINLSKNTSPIKDKEPPLIVSNGSPSSTNNDKPVNGTSSSDSPPNSDSTSKVSSSSSSNSNCSSVHKSTSKDKSPECSSARKGKSLCKKPIPGLAPSPSLADGKKLLQKQKRKAAKEAELIYQKIHKKNLEEDDDDEEDSDDDNSFHIGESQMQGFEDDEEETDDDVDDEDTDEELEEEEDEEDSDEEELEDEDRNDDDENTYNDFSMTIREEPGYDSGCTACVVLMDGYKILVANVGDSRCVVCRDGVAVDMSVDHKPEDEVETNRIVKAGGKITRDGRVNGGLNLSRAIGDHSYKQNKGITPSEQMISPLPDVKTLELTPKDSFMIIACDGIWNSLSSQEACDFVKEKIEKSKKLSFICEDMFDYCLAPNVFGDGTGCDNMTCVIVRFHNIPERNGEANQQEETTNLEKVNDIKPSKETKIENSNSSPVENKSSKVLEKSDSSSEEEKLSKTKETEEESCSQKRAVEEDDNIGAPQEKRTKLDS